MDTLSMDAAPCSACISTFFHFQNHHSDDPDQPNSKGITSAHSKGLRDGEKAAPANHQVHSVHVFNGPIKYSKCKSYKLPWKGFSRFKNGAIFWIYDLCLRPINKKVVYPEVTGKCYLAVCIFGRFLPFPSETPWPFPEFLWLQQQNPRCHNGNELSKEWTESPAGWFIPC